MRGLKKMHGEWTSDRHVKSMTDPAQRAKSVKITKLFSSWSDPS